MEALILAAGLGTRMREFTQKGPKALIQIGDTCLLEILIKKLIASDIRHIVINVHHFADQIVEFLEHNIFEADISLSDEREELLDTGGALKKARPLFSEKESILVHNVDILSDVNFSELQAHLNKPKGSLASLCVSERETHRNFLFNESLSLRGWINKASGEEILCKTEEKIEVLLPFAFSGIQLVSPHFLSLLPEKNCFSLVEAYLGLASQYRIGAFLHPAAHWLDVGKPEALPTAERLLQTL